MQLTPRTGRLMARSDGLQRVYSELPENFIRLMRNWASSEAGVGSWLISRVYKGMPRTIYAGGRVPILRGEASDVELAMRVLQPAYRVAVVLFWSFEGMSFRQLAERCGLACHQTYQSRLSRGHEQLRAELARRSAQFARLEAENRETARRL